MKIKYEKLDEDERDVLHCQYAGQHKPQPCVMEYDPISKRVSFWYDSNIGGICRTTDSLHNMTLSWGVAPGLLPRVANEFVETISHLLLEISAEYRQEWDGNNHVGLLTTKGGAISVKIEMAIDDLERDPTNFVQVWKASDWFEAIRDEHVEKTISGMPKTGLKSEVENDPPDDDNIVIVDFDDYVDDCFRLADQCVSDIVEYEIDRIGVELEQEVRGMAVRFWDDYASVVIPWSDAKVALKEMREFSSDRSGESIHSEFWGHKTILKQWPENFKGA